MSAPPFYRIAPERSHPVNLLFEDDKGFTLADLFQSIHKGYTRIYADAETYGIWGHGIADLVIEGINEIEPGVFELRIGS
jgi:hypothetical protein